MQKRILLVASALGILLLFFAGAYYIAIHLPQKQKADMELVKLELESKIEQEKTEQLKIEQENQQLENEKQNKLTEEIKKQTESKEQQQQIASSSLNKCLDDANTAYSKKIEQLKAKVNSGDYTADVLPLINSLETTKNQARNECYK